MFRSLKSGEAEFTLLVESSISGRVGGSRSLGDDSGGGSGSGSGGGGGSLASPTTSTSSSGTSSGSSTSGGGSGSGTSTVSVGRAGSSVHSGTLQSVEELRYILTTSERDLTITYYPV
jgi:hypothetical protein